ncbi:AMP-binding protein, partial [Streptomyces sp. P17]|uniref:AMP-binding protein n=1 Tax=Streptomyces sp. P17 TaxID=3074716 RepID=UPI0028F43AF2
PEPPPARRQHAPARAGAVSDAGVAPGQSVALLLRNDFAFFEASVAAQTIGAYATPINWHNTPDEIGYVLRDCGATVLVGHDDLLAKLGDAVPAGTVVLAVAT